MSDDLDWPDDLGKPKRSKRQPKSKVESAEKPEKKEYVAPRPNLTLAKRFAAQGLDRESTVELARMVSYSNEKMANWVKAYDAHEFAERMTYESYCENNENVPNSLEFYALVIALHVEIHKIDSVTMAQTALPRIVKKSIEAADEINGFRDREMLMRIGNMPGMQSGSAINITNTVNASNNFLAAGVPRFNSDADDDSTREILERTLPQALPAAREEYIDAIEIPREKELK